MKNLLFGLFICFGLNAFATVQIVEVKGASQVRMVDGNATVFGGLSGPVCVSKDGGLCDSCVDAMALNSLTACNHQRVTNVAKISFTATSDTKGNFQWVLTNAMGTPTNFRWPHADGNVHVLNTMWMNLCQAAFGLDCESVADGSMATIRLGLWDGNALIDSKSITVVMLAPTSNTIDDCSTLTGGICSFRVQSTSKGVFLTDFQADESFPAYIDRIRVFASPKDFISATPGNALYTQDLAVDDDGTILENKLDVKTDEMLFIRLATVDMAGNIYNFMSDTNIQDPNFGNCSSLNDMDPNSGCHYRFVPQSKK